MTNVFDNLKKGDKVHMTYGSSISSKNEVHLIVKNRTVVGIGKPFEAEKITFVNTKNPSGVKYFGYKRKASGKISYAVGDMAISVVEIVKEMATGGRTSKTKDGKFRYTVHVYYGGEMPDETFNTNSLSEAKKMAMRGEHGEIIDNQLNKIVEMAKGGITAHGLKEGDSLGKSKDNRVIVYPYDPQGYPKENTPQVVNVNQGYRLNAKGYSMMTDEQKDKFDKMKKGGKTKEKEPKIVRSFVDDEPYEYGKGGSINWNYSIGGI
jgi:hypothetical protein